MGCQPRRPHSCWLSDAGAARPPAGPRRAGARPPPPRRAARLGKPQLARRPPATARPGPLRADPTAGRPTRDELPRAARQRRAPRPPGGWKAAARRNMSGHVPARVSGLSRPRGGTTAPHLPARGTPRPPHVPHPSTRHPLALGGARRNRLQPTCIAAAALAGAGPLPPTPATATSRP